MLVSTRRKQLRNLFFALCGTLSFSSQADEGIYPKGALTQLGYKVAAPYHRISALRVLQGKDPNNHFARPYFNNGLGPQLLTWPVRFEDATHTLGNNMVQFQKYGFTAPYFHGGCDLRAAAESDVRAPVAGMIEAGHYGYETQANGSLKKFWTPYPKTGDRMYFEIAIVAADGLRYEFHHVNRATLPSRIKQLLDRGGGRVEAGEIIGRVIAWPVSAIDKSRYHHIHYNVLTADGVHLNPEALSQPLADNTAPEIHGVYAIAADGKVTELKSGSAAPRPLPVEIIVAATDKSEPNIYTHAPSLVELSTANGLKSGWNFKATLEQGPHFEFPDIRLVFASTLRLANGQKLETKGDYEGNFFLYRLKLPQNAQLPIEIRVEDASGTAKTFILNN